MDARMTLRTADAKDGKKTGDRQSVGLFIPLPEHLAELFPSLGDEDKSDAHITFLYVGEVTEARENVFLEALRSVSSHLGPIRAHMEPMDYFVHPAKDRRVAIVPWRFSRDLSDLRWRMRDALQAAGFIVDDSFPLLYNPHTTLEYVDGLEGVYEGSVPSGDFVFDEIEVWGLPQVHAVPLGNVTEKSASRVVDAMTNRASVALMKFLSGVATRLGVGRHVYVVGGAVRNFIINQPIKDIDVVIDSVALKGKNSEWFAQEVRKAIPVKTNLITDNYGVAKVKALEDWIVDGHNLKGEEIEIANARTESYGGQAGKGYKPHLVEPSTIDEDVVRREFTFNCMAGDTLIPTEKGILRIDEIASREGGAHQDIHLTVAGQEGPAVAVGWQYSGFAPTLRVTTEWDHSFSCTHHHPVMVLRGHDHEWVQANQLEEGDLLCAPVRQITRREPLALGLLDPVQPKRGKLKEVRKPQVMTPELAFMIGCVVAEGSNTHKRVAFSNSDEALISRYAECFNATFGFQPSRNKVVEKGSVRVLRGVEFVANADGYDIYADSKAVVGWLDALGLYCGGSKDGKSASHHKVVPWSILQADERSQWAFLAAYLEGDGSIRPDTGRITFCSASPSIRQQLQVLLGAHGILSKVKDRFVYINAVDSALLWEKVQPWMVSKGFDYTQRDTKARNRYGIPKEHLQGVLKGCRVRVGNNQGPSTYHTDDGGETVQSGLLEKLRRPKRLLHDAYARGDFDELMAGLKAISPDECAKLHRLFSLGYQYVEVTSVEDAGKQDVFDISMGEGVEPVFVANGVVVHNTLLWRLMDLAKGPDKAEIVDLTGCGLKDLKDGVAKCPRDPDIVFSDDPSRMVRAIKFLLKYGLKLSPDVVKSIQKNKHKLKNIPAAHLSNMIIGVFYEGGIGKKALLEMKKLGLLDVVKEIAQTDKGFRSALGRWADRKADLGFVFDLMDLGMPSGKRLGKFSDGERKRIRDITVLMDPKESARFVDVLSQHGKVIDTRALIAEFGLKGADVKRIGDAAKDAILYNPVLAANGRKLEEAVRQRLGGRRASFYDVLAERQQARTAKTFEMNIGDPVLYGKYKNKKGIIREFKMDEKGKDPVIVVEPDPKGRKDDKELKLFKVRYDEARKDKDAARTASYVSLTLNDQHGRPIGTYNVPEASLPLLLDGQDVQIDTVTASESQPEKWLDAEPPHPHQPRQDPIEKDERKGPRQWGPRRHPHPDGVLDEHAIQARVKVPHGQWIQGLPKDLDLDQRQEVWSLYHTSYGAIGKHIQSVAAMAAKYKVYWLQDVDGDSTIDAFLAYKSTSYGDKIGLLGSDGSSAAKRSLITQAFKLLRTSGWYAELSGKPAEMAAKSGVPMLRDQAQVEKVVPGSTWLGDGWYTRQIGSLGSKKKALFGKPRIGSVAARVAARYQQKKEVPKADGKGTTTVYEYSEGQVAHRNREKAKRVEKLRQNLGTLQGQIKKDLKSKDDKTRMTALVVGLINDTYERVGNEGSAKDGHFGVTGWQAKHVTVSGGKATFKYVGKSGVTQTKTTKDGDLVRVLKEALKGKSGTDAVFDVGSSDVNEYLKTFDITAKDIRGLHANREMQERLKAVRSKGGKLPSDEKERTKKLKDEFQKALEGASEAVGHESATLKSQYLVPGLEDDFLKDGTVSTKLTKKAMSQPGQLGHLSVTKLRREPRIASDADVYALWKLLDDIDTAGDMCKGDHDCYERVVGRAQAKRWDVVDEPRVDELYDRFHGQPLDPERPWETCPVCGEKFQTTCRCHLGDKTCPNGHKWLWCEEHERAVVIPEGVNTHDMGLPREGCRCQLLDPEYVAKMADEHERLKALYPIPKQASKNPGSEDSFRMAATPLVTVQYLQKLISAVTSDPAGWGDSSPAARILDRKLRGLKNEFSGLKPFPVSDLWLILKDGGIDADEMHTLKGVTVPRPPRAPKQVTFYDAITQFERVTGKSWQLRGISLEDDQYAQEVIRWTRAVKSLDKLPLVKKLWDSEVQKVRFGTVQGTEDASWEHKLLALSVKGIGRMSIPSLRYTLIHELGHALDAKTGGWRDSDALWGYPPYVSAYAAKNGNEDLAESFASYVTEPRKLRQVSPEKYADIARRLGRKTSHKTASKTPSTNAIKLIQVMAKGAGHFGITRAGADSFGDTLEKFDKVMASGGRTATKTHAEKEDAEAERLVRPKPKLKPPRKDLRRERMDTGDSDTDSDGKADKDKDLSLNYKRVAARYLMKVAGKVPKDQKPKKPGDYWQTKAGWGVFPPDAKVPTSAPDEATAKRLSEPKGGASAEDDGKKVSPEDAKAKEKAKRSEARKKDKTDVDNLTKFVADSDPAVVKALGSLKGATRQKFMEDYRSEMEVAKKEILDDDGVMDPDMVKGMTEAFQMLRGKSPMSEGTKDLARSLALAKAAVSIVANPSMLGGKRLTNTEKDSQELRARAEQAANHYASLSPELRVEAAKQALAKLDRIPEGRPMRAELDSIVDGLALAAGANGESLIVDGKQLRPDMAPEFQALAKGMLEQKTAGPLLGTLREYHSPESREVIRDSMKSMKNEDMYKVAGGQEGPYGAIIKAMEGGDLSPEKMALARSWLEGMTVDNMTVGESVLSSAAEAAGGGDPEKVDKIMKAARAKVRKDPKVKSAIDKLLACLTEADNGEAEDRCRDEYPICKITQLAATVNAAEEAAGKKLDAGDPILAQLRAVIETGNLAELEQTWVREGVRSESLGPPAKLSSIFYL